LRGTVRTSSKIIEEASSQMVQAALSKSDVYRILPDIGRRLGTAIILIACV
jgi:hypothetical protein